MNTHPSTRLYFIMCIIIIMYNLTKDLQYTHHRVACRIICVSFFVDKNVCVIIVFACLFVFGFYWCCARFVKQGVCISERYTWQSNLCYYSFLVFLLLSMIIIFAFLLWWSISYKMEHLFFFFFFTCNAARVAVSNTSRTPSLVLAEHSK